MVSEAPPDGDAPLEKLFVPYLSNFHLEIGRIGGLRIALKAVEPDNQQYNLHLLCMLENAFESSVLTSLEAEFLGRIGARIIHQRSTSSTMDGARKLVEETDDLSCLHGTVIIADEQTKGRGRFGRSWDSSRGDDILASVILSPRLAITGGLTTMASLASAMTVDEFAKCISSIKWPNDVLVDGKKICGVIAESSTTGSSFVGVIGIGLNVNRLATDNVRQDYSATSIREILGLEKEVDRREVVRAMLANLNELHDALVRGESIMPEWRDKLRVLGSFVEVTMASEQNVEEVISGVAEDVDEFGRLLIRGLDGNLRALAAGEVTMRVEQDGQ